jgi:Fe-S cluster biogenesis protein NfuA/nitrite reductase/ring-hydroxylating ferredoxin subunit
LAGHEEQGFQRRIARIETLVHGVESIADPAARAGAEELVQALLDLHGTGLGRIMDIVAESGAAAPAIFGHLAGDDLVGSLLMLHGLHPEDCETRVLRALDSVRPYLGSHGGDVELLGIVGEVVKLRLGGSCHGCPSSAMTLKLAIEDAIYEAAPEVSSIEVEGVVERPAPPPNFVPLAHLRDDGTGLSSNGRGAKPTNGILSIAWQQVGDLASLDADAVRTLDVAGRTVSFCRVGETFYAYDNLCPRCARALAGARLEATALVCPGCGRRYDVQRAGQGLDDPRDHLEPFPLLAEGGRVKVALPVLGG